MSADVLPDALRSLILHHMPSMDHVAVLLAMRAEPDAVHQPVDLAHRTRLDRVVIDKVVRDLVASLLVQRDGAGFRYTPPPELLPTIEELAHMYRTKPVTLVRVLYDRPARAVTSFADAFRVRKSN